MTPAGARPPLLRLLAAAVSATALTAAAPWWHPAGPSGPAFYVEAPEGRFAVALPADAPPPAGWLGAADTTGWATLEGGRAIGLDWNGGPSWVRVEVVGEEAMVCAASSCEFGGEGPWHSVALPRDGLTPLGVADGSVLGLGADALWSIPLEGSGGAVQSLSPEDAAKGGWIQAADGPMLVRLGDAVPDEADWFPWGVPATAPGRLVGARDTVRVRAWLGAAEETADVSVGAEGDLQFQMVRVPVAGLTEAEAEDALESALGEYWVDPLVEVRILGRESYRVTVLGAVSTPGELSRVDPYSLFEALAAAGPTSMGDLSSIRLLGRDGSTTVVDLFSLLNDPGRAPGLLPAGSVLFVPTLDDSPRSVYVLGEVGRPGAVLWAEGATLASALAGAGGLTDDAESVALVVSEDGEHRELKISRGHADLSTPVSPGDVVFIRKDGLSSFAEPFRKLRPVFLALLTPIQILNIIDNL